jgi:hypothetical protein
MTSNASLLRRKARGSQHIRGTPSMKNFYKRMRGKEKNFKHFRFRKTVSKNATFWSVYGTSGTDFLSHDEIKFQRDER